MVFVNVSPTVLNFESLNNILRTMQKVIFRYEGFVRQFIHDDKGCTLIAVFGVPFTHEDDSSRGVSTAIYIHNQLKVGMRVRVGVSVRECLFVRVRDVYACMYVCLCVCACVLVCCVCPIDSMRV